MATETLFIQDDPDDADDPGSYLRRHPVVSRIEVPPKAQSNGWGEIPKGRRR